jgi:hypothetical protein
VSSARLLLLLLSWAAGPRLLRLFLLRSICRSFGFVFFVLQQSVLCVSRLY